MAIWALCIALIIIEGLDNQLCAAQTIPYGPGITAPTQLPAYFIFGPKPISASCNTSNYNNCPVGSVVGDVANGASNISIQVAGTFSATLQFESALDCVNFTPLPLIPQGGGSAVSTTTTVGMWSGVLQAQSCVQVRATSYTSGTANITISVSAGGSVATTIGGGGSGGTVTQGGAPWSFTGSGTAGSAAAGVVSVQGIAGMTPLSVTGVSGAPLTGGATGVAYGSNQMVDIAGSNGTTIDAVRTGTTFPQTGGSFPVNGVILNNAAMNCTYSTTAITATTGNFYPCQLDSSGNVKVDIAAGGSITATFPYSGTSSGQTATTQSFLGAGCVYNSSAPTVSNGQFVPCQSNVNGAMNVACVSANCNAPFTGGATGIGNAVGQGYAMFAQGPSGNDALKAIGQMLGVYFTPGGIPTNATVTQISSTACANLASSALTWGVALTNANANAQTATLTLYNENNTSCATADQQYQIVLGGGETFVLPIGVKAWTNGLSYKFSIAPAANVLITYL